MNKKDLCYFEELLQKYKKKPVLCSYCGKPLTFKEYVAQFDQENKFCTKKCFYKYKDSKETKDLKKFNSLTEKVIFNYLSEKYPDKDIEHNVDYLIPPYEVDFVFTKDKLVIEYNGTLHYSSKYGKRKCKKTKFNDKKKKKIICNDLGWNLCRLWSTIGLYTREHLFRQALKVLKENIDGLIKSHCYGNCIDIIILKDGSIEIFYNENDLRKIYKEDNV